MDIERLYFKDEVHRKAFLELLEGMYLSADEMKLPTQLLKRQFAFAYLIALYQKDYELYEGEGFYIEIGEELSLGGPTYLMDERYGERTKEYEKIIPIACEFLKERIYKEENVHYLEKQIKGFRGCSKEVLKQALDMIN